MKLSELIHAPSVIAELQATDRNGVIREMTQALADHGALSKGDVEAVARAVITRENQGSTGFGKGVAVPHVKHEGVKKMVATIGRSSHGVDFAALDRAPVYTVVMLLSPASAPEEHLAAMKSQVGAVGGRMAVVMAPLQPQLDEQFRAKDLAYVLKPQRTLAQICAKVGVPLLDLYPALLHRGGPRLFSDHYHLTASGHRVVAEALLHFLREQGLL